MKSSGVTLLKLVLFASMLALIPGAGAASRGAQNIAPPGVQAAAPAPLDLADIIPRAEELSVRLDVLESKTEALPDPGPIEKEFALVEKRLALIVRQLDEIKGPRRAQYGQLLNLRAVLAAEAQSLAAASKPLNDSINVLAKADREWKAEEERWTAWHSSLVKEKTAQPVRAALARALSTINAAQEMISRQLAGLLVAQTKGARVKAKVDRHAEEVRARLVEAREKSLTEKSAPMYSPQFFDAFGPRLWSATRDSVTVFLWPDVGASRWQNPGIGIFLVLFLAVTVLIYRNRRSLGESGRWRFVAERPVATALLICATPLLIFLELADAHAGISLGASIVGGIACVRLLGSVLGQSWKKQAAYGVIISYLITMILFELNLPLPLVRLYLFAAALLGLIFCVRWAGGTAGRTETRGGGWMLWSIAILCVVTLLADVLGEAGVAVYLFESALLTMTTAFLLILFVHVLRGGLHGLFIASPVRNIELIRDNASDYERRIGGLLEVAVFIFVFIPVALAAWGVFGSYPDAVRGLLEPGFSLGSQHISVGLILLALGTLYGSWLAALIIPRILFDQRFAGRRMDRGARVSVGRLLQYFIVFVGFLLTLGLIGLDFTKLTIILSAFGVGIGFGLQSIVNNFVSGLILLFERPLREGDTIEVGKERVHIRKIGLRATHVKTFDMADVIIPNAEFVNNPVTNWTLGDRRMRLSVPVGVSYGSDIRLVAKSLLACAEGHAAVLKSPAPEVLLLDFGDSSLNFELRVWILDVDSRLRVRSELYGNIVDKFREVGVEIPFPQRDLHLRSADESLIARFTQQGGPVPDAPGKSA